MNNFHVSLSYQGKPCQFDLVAGQESKNSVKINGVSYAVITEDKQLATVKQVLAAVSLKPINSEQKLEGRLKKLADSKDVAVTPSISKIGSKTLGPKQEFHLWKQDEDANLPKRLLFLVNAYWDNRGNKSEHSALRQYLGPEKFEKFDHAMKTSDFEMFKSLFNDLSANDLWNIRNTENCHPVGDVKTTPYEITKEDISNLKQYLDDIGFSGTVSLSDAKGSYHISPTKLDLENIPFSINSIAKVFTGTLALLTMPPEAFAEKLKLPPSLLSDLKKYNEPVYNHLEKPTLLQTMNHNGGFGDYLFNYEKAIVEALKNGDNPPAINRPEDFLKYSESTIHPLDKGIYSNLGILFVGLAVQHKCGGKPFNQLLQELVLVPAKMSISTSKPSNGKYNATDHCQGMVVGSPSGGYWTTAKEMLKLGSWLKDKCNTDPEFLSLMKRFGTEFYVPEDEEIRHNGNSSAGSSFLSSFQKSGVTISVLSDQGNFMANRIYYTIREKLIEQK